MSPAACFRRTSIHNILALRPPQPTVPIATSEDLKTWRLVTDTVTAPLHELRTRTCEASNRFRSASGALLLFIFTFSRQLKGLSGCYEYFGQHRGSPCFKRCRLPQLFLVKSSGGLWCTSNDLIHFECPNKSLEIASAAQWQKNGRSRRSLRG